MRANHIHNVQKAQWARHSYITYQDNPIDMPTGKSDVDNPSIEVLLLDDSSLCQSDRHSSRVASLLTLEPYPFPLLYCSVVAAPSQPSSLLALVYEKKHAQLSF